MKIFGHTALLICCLLSHFSNFTSNRYELFSTTLSVRIGAIVIRGLMFLVYPLLGHLADVCLNRYRAIKFSYMIPLVAMAVLIVYQIIQLLLLIFIGYSSLNKSYFDILAAAIIGLSFMACMVGEGLYTANAIQFGLDQLLEAPTPKLINFIHWYYWCQNVGKLILFYLAATFQIVDDCHMFNIKAAVKSLLGSGIVFAVIIANFCFFSWAKKYIYVQGLGLNPFKNIYKVLKYSWNHKIPEHRSAFTYWEEDIPRRIDLGKNKYGGPFTNEVVEDTKTFLRILPLMLCLFGYHLAGDGYSAPEQLQRTSCPSLPVLLLIVINPQHLAALVTVVGIPLYQLVIRVIFPRIKLVLMLTRMWIGLYLALLQVVINIIILTNHNNDYWKQHHTTLNISTRHQLDPAFNCYRIRKGFLSNDSTTCKLEDDDLVDNTYLWFIIPQLLNGLSSLLVSMTMFEFICAQAPRNTQGLLIGLWYATFSIRYLFVGMFDTFIQEDTDWLICEGVKGFLILVSLALFSSVSRRYRYRQRDEIVNVQGMIEDTHERWLDQEEEYMQERRALYQDYLRNSG